MDWDHDLGPIAAAWRRPGPPAFGSVGQGPFLPRRGSALAPGPGTGPLHWALALDPGMAQRAATTMAQPAAWLDLDLQTTTGSRTCLRDQLAAGPLLVVFLRHFG